MMFRKVNLQLCSLLFFVAAASLSYAQLKVGQQPELIVQSGHTGVTLNAIAFSANLRWLASGGSDGQVILWNLDTGFEARTIRAHTGPLLSICLSADGHYIASTGSDGRIALHDATTGATVKEIKVGKEEGLPLALSNDGTLLAWGSGSNVDLWNRASSVPPKSIAALPGKLTSLAFSPNGTQLAVGSETGSVEILNLATPNRSIPLRGQAGEISSSAFSRDGTTVATASSDRTICIWHLATSRRPVCKAVDRTVWSLAFFANSQVVSVTSNELEKSVYILRLDSATGGIIESTAVRVNIGSFFFQTMGRWPQAISPDGSRAAFGSDFSTILVWDVTKHSVERKLNGITVGATDIAISPSRRWIAIAIGNNVQVWDVVAGTARVIRTGYKRSIRALAFNTKSDVIGTISEDEEFDAWYLPTSKSRLRLRGGGPKYSDARQVAVIDKTDSTVKIWSLENFDKKEQRKIPLKHNIYGFDRLVISEGGKWLALATQLSGEIHVLNLTTEEEKPVVTKSGFHFLGPMKFSSDEKYLGWPSIDGSIKILDMDKGNVHRFCCHSPRYATSLAFSSSGNLIASGGEDTKIRIWNLMQSKFPEEDTPVAILEGHSGAVHSLLFVPEKPVLVSTDQDGTARVWHLAKDKVEESARFIFLRDNSGWLAVTKEGLFDGAADAIRYVSWRIPMSNSVFPMAAFYNDFFHPSLAAEVLNGESPTPCVDIATILRLPGSRTMQLQRALRVENRDGVPTLCLPEAPDYSFFQNVAVTWKGLPVPVDVSAFHAGDSPGCEYQLSLPNVSGRVEVNGTGAAFFSELTRRCHHSSEPPFYKSSCAAQGAPTGELHVAIFAVSEYPSSSNYEALSQSVEQDAIELAKFFRDKQTQSHDAYKRVHPSDPILGADATLDNIRRKFAAMQQEVKQDDTVLIFLSGHGNIPPGQEEFYFIPVDGMRSMEADTGLSTAMLVDLVRDLPSRRVVLIIDACQSGGGLDALAKVAEARASAEKRLSESLVQPLADQAYTGGLGIHVVAAATPFQSALIVNGSDLFGESLLDILQHPADKRANICAGSLGPLIEAELMAKTANLAESQSILVVSKGLDFVLAGSSAVEKSQTETDH